jgi:rhodanese-related sulfurtransferase
MTPVDRLPEVDARSAADLLAGGAVALDVREDDEWEAGRIGGAIHIPVSELAYRQGEIPPSRLIVVCRSGSRSAYATEELIRAGYEAENLVGGMKAWKEAGLAIEPANGFVE